MKKISVIIPAYNEEKLIRRSIRSVKKQNYGNFEIVVVANGCTDRTEKIAQIEGAKVVVLHEANVSLARNEGVKHSEGPILVFMDADAVMDAKLLKSIADAMNAGFIGATCRIRPDKKTRKNRLICSINNISNYFYLLPSGLIACPRVHFAPFDIRMKVSEDAVMFRKLARKGKLKYITDSSIKLSMRRFDKENPIVVLFKYIWGRWFVKNPRYDALR